MRLLPLIFLFGHHVRALSQDYRGPCRNLLKTKLFTPVAGPTSRFAHLDYSESLCTNKRQRNKIISSVYNKYLELCEHRPFLTKAVSASIVAGLGGVLCQWVQASSRRVTLVMDWHLVRSFALTGLVFEGPYMHLWYEQLFRLGRFLESKNVSSRIMTGAQILVDQTVGVAVFFPAYFLAYELIQSLTLLRGPDLALVGARIGNELLHIVRTNYMVWPLVTYVIFRRVPEALRVLVSSIVAIFWNAYLCSRIAL